MKYTILKYGMLAGALLFGGCSNWLDVDPKSQVKQEALFESEAGCIDGYLHHDGTYGHVRGT